MRAIRSKRRRARSACFFCFLGPGVESDSIGFNSGSMVNVVFFNYLDLKSKLLRSNGDFMGFNQQEEGFSGD